MPLDKCGLFVATVVACALALVVLASCQDGPHAPSGGKPAGGRGAGDSGSPPAGSRPASEATTSSQPAGLSEAIGQAVLDWFDGAIAGGMVEKMVPAAEKAAEAFIAGGDLYVAGNEGFCDELHVRAGGFPFTQYLSAGAPGKNDVVLIGQYRTDGSDYDWDIFDARQRKDMLGSAMVVHLGSHDWPHLKGPAGRAATRPAEGLYLFDTKAGRGDSWQAQCLGQLATTALAWAFHGEVISAATRKGKTLATYASDWEPGGPEWDDTVRHEHLHPSIKVPAIPAGKLGNEYLRICRKQVADFIATQAQPVRKAAGMMARSLKRGGTVWVVTNSHIHTRGSPVPRQLPGVSMCGREGAWRGAVNNMQSPDVLLWLGYLRYPADEIAEAVARGQAVVLCADDGPKDEHRVNLRACWKDFDTVIDLPKYPIRVLPSTGTVGCAQWYCIMAETAALYRTK